MLNTNSFHINFNYSLSEKIVVNLKAFIVCDYMHTCYAVSELEVVNNASGQKNFDNEIKIIPVINEDHIEWLHADSLRSSILSSAIGKAIEATGNVEMLRRREAAA
ncbi:hypothetical protein FRZ67_10915 [Panacibacter ginsenosidivorans]|uniref:Uncharacterized protein n=1 Tax=Panacibacter ginsenosidivorans TaxID=1813871 RepID=A0A5B8VA89_9BACT|nr:hypothetical protein [Panacibacter ginsenosidivorans]QEC67781.1 hypothetical protein FRZ67_10915 [Panacibacter ginsenosidivorans]